MLACRNHIIVDHGPFVENEYRHSLLQKLSYVYNFFSLFMKDVACMMRQEGENVGRHCLIGQCLWLFVVRVPIIGLVD